MQRDGKMLEEISASITRYYDSLTDEEKAENLAWGHFSEVQMSVADDWNVPLGQPHSK